MLAMVIRNTNSVLETFVVAKVARIGDGLSALDKVRKEKEACTSQRIELVAAQLQTNDVLKGPTAFLGGMLFCLCDNLLEEFLNEFIDVAGLIDRDIDSFEIGGLGLAMDIAVCTLKEDVGLECIFLIEFFLDQLMNDRFLGFEVIFDVFVTSFISNMVANEEAVESRFKFSDSVWQGQLHRAWSSPTQLLLRTTVALTLMTCQGSVMKKILISHRTRKGRGHSKIRTDSSSETRVNQRHYPAEGSSRNEELMAAIELIYTNQCYQLNKIYS